VGTFKKLCLRAAYEAAKTNAQKTETTITKERNGARSSGFQNLPATKQLMHPMAAPKDDSGMLTSERIAP
jgi:hypothetical protein